MRDDQFGLDSFGDGGLNHQADIESLINDIGLEANEIEWQKEFLNFDQEDAANISKYDTISPTYFVT